MRPIRSALAKCRWHETTAAIAERPMVRPTFTRLLVITVLPLAAACGPKVRKAAQAPGKPVQTARPAPLPILNPTPLRVEDPVLTLIAESEHHFEAGQHELELGHVAAAKQEFDRAVNVLLESAYGGRTEARLREHFDRLGDRISA